MDMDTAMLKLQPWIEANGPVENWVAGARALALLRAALASGMLDAAQTARTPNELAEITGIEANRVPDLCAALEAHGVFDHLDGCYTLSSRFATLFAPDVFQTLSALLDIRKAEVRAIESAGLPSRAYTTLASEDMQAIAEGITLRPAAEHGRAILRSWFADGMPEVHALLEAGGHWAEFGCWMGGGLLSMLLTYPTMTAVGMEINGQINAETRRRAVEWEVIGRVELRHGDVRTQSAHAVFDGGFWSQCFFPSTSRAATLATIARSLKPGGYLVIPGFEGGEPPTGDTDPRGAENMAFTLCKVVYQRWDIPARTAAELREEAENAGLEFARYVPLLAWQNVLMRRPVG